MSHPEHFTNGGSGSFQLDAESQNLDGSTSRKRPRNPSPTQRVPAAYDRRRAPRACLVCRQRKTKCDNQRPACGFCVAAGGECIYPDADTTKFDRASQAILDRISEMESNVMLELKRPGSRSLYNDNQQWHDANYYQSNGMSLLPLSMAE